MSSINEEILKHNSIYVPWIDGKDTPQIGAQLALHLSKQHNTRLTIVCPTKSNAPDELEKFPTVTERSGAVTDGGVILAYCPTYKLVKKFAHQPKSITLLVEWPTESFLGWAKLAGAYNLATQETLQSGLDEEGYKQLKAVVFEGYKGWHDHIAERVSLGHLRKLNDAGQYDRELVLAYARNEKGEDGIKRLYKLLDRFDATVDAA